MAKEKVEVKSTPAKSTPPKKKASSKDSLGGAVLKRHMKAQSKVKRVSGDAVIIMENKLNELLALISNKAQIFFKHANRKSMTVPDVELALRMGKIPFLSGALVADKANGESGFPIAKLKRMIKGDLKFNVGKETTKAVGRAVSKYVQNICSWTSLIQKNLGKETITKTMLVHSIAFADAVAGVEKKE